MTQEEKRNIITYNLNVINSLFNSKKVPRKDWDFQFIFHEPEGCFQYYLSIRNQTSKVVEGVASKPVCTIITDLETWEGIGGGYITPIKAVTGRRFKIDGNLLIFLIYFQKIYCGGTNWQLPKNLYFGSSSIEKIRKVLILCCSPRIKKGATYLMVERIAKGMQKTGAEVEILFPAQMKINPCRGCFQCWVWNSKECIYHHEDEMKLILEKYYSTDLLIWATPIYYYHCSTVMKTVMDRFFINVDPHFIKVGKVYCHPRKNKHLPYQALLAVGGFPSRDIFKPLQSTFNTLSRHTGTKLIAELFICFSMSFLLENGIKKKDKVLEALEIAGSELINLKRVTRKTKRQIEQMTIPARMIIPAVNYHMDIMQSAKKNLFENSYKPKNFLSGKR